MALFACKYHIKIIYIYYNIRNKMEMIKHANKNYILGDNVLAKAPIFSKGCRGTRALVKKKNISLDKYIFGRFVDNKWELSSNKSVKYDKVFLEESIINGIPEMSNTNAVIMDDNGIEKAPPIIHLNDDEKFKDENGAVIEIETRGSRNADNIYFKVKDVEKGFDIPSLQIVINDTRNSYKLNTDYKYFITEKHGNPMINNSKKTTKKPAIKSSKKTITKSIIQKKLYLTYMGMLHMLFVTRNNKTSHFIKWASDILFTVQMGTKKQKESLAGNILGVPAKTVKEVFNINANALPCVYLFSLNTVKNLRTSMNIDAKYADDAVVCKYGFTKELSRRTAEHIDTFKKIDNVDLKLKCYSFMDPQYMSKGESDIRSFMNAMGISIPFQTMEEIVVISKEHDSLVQKQYELIGKNYMGHSSELITQIKELQEKHETEKLKYAIELQKEQFLNKQLTHQLELQTEKFHHEMLKKDFEMLKMQMILTQHS